MKKYWFVIAVAFFSGCFTGSFFTHRGMKLEVREAKIEGIKCIGELVQCEMKLEKK